MSGWHNNYLSFDGINDWVNCGEINYPNATLETAYLDKSGTNKEILCNYDVGGLGIMINEGVYKSSLYNEETYHYAISNETSRKNQLLTQSMSYNGQEQDLYLSGSKIASTQTSGDINSPKNNTVMALRL